MVKGSKKKNAKRIAKMTRFTRKDYLEILKRAKRYTEGNFTEFLTLAALSFRTKSRAR